MVMILVIFSSCLDMSINPFRQPSVGNYRGRDFIEAVAAGDIEKVQKFLKRGYKANQKYMFYPVLIAAVHRQDAMLRYLVEQGADLSVRDTHFGRTALHFCAEQGMYSTIEYLLDQGMDINAQDYDKNTPLHLAVDSHKKKAIRLLLEKGSDLNVKNQKGYFPLDMAIEYTKNGLFNMLKQEADWKKMNTEAASSFLCRILFARNRAWYDWVVALPQIDVSYSSGYGQSPLQNALVIQDEDIVSDLLKRGADPFRVSGGMPLRCSSPLTEARNGSDNLYEKIKSAALKQKKVTDIQKHLIWSITVNSWEWFSFFLDRGVDINEPLVYNEPPSYKNIVFPLLYAVYSKREYMAWELIDQKADLTVTDERGRGLVYYAFNWGSVRLLRYAVDQGLSTKGVVVSNSSTFKDPVYNGDKERIEYLLELGLNPNIPLHNGDTVIMLARDLEFRKWLKTKGFKYPNELQD